MPPAGVLADGATFAGFTIMQLVGTGSTGTVYLAEHPHISGQVALKILHADVSADPALRQQFEREVDLWATLSHPNIVSVLDHGESGRRLWLATPYVDGPDAGRLLRERYPAGMPPSAVSLIVDNVSQAVDFAHRHDLLHRHIKPANILLNDPYSGDYRILLTDFGTAPRLDRLGRHTTPGFRAELGEYAAPEQSTDGRIDGQTDQYGLAATAFHLLTGTTPFARTDSADPDRNNPPFTSLAHTHPDLAKLAPVFARALATDPAARFTTCRDFAAALAQAEAKSVSTGTAPPAAPVPTPRRITTNPSTPPVSSALRRGNGEPAPSTSVRRHARRYVVVAAVVVAVLATAAMYFGTIRPSPSARPGSQAATPAMTPTPVPPPPPRCDDLPAPVAALSMRDKLAQLLMVGVTGATDARAVIRDQHVGGIFIASWTDLSMLTDGSLHDISASAGPLPLAVSVDEEGGRVQRLSSLIGRQPSAKALAQTRSPAEVHDIAFQRGRQMRDLGITVDFAPVVDVTDAPDNTVIGDRSFGSDPQQVTIYAGAYAQGLRDAGVLPVLKHFPGHGHGSGDSHQGGVTTPGLDELQKDDLIPYRTLATTEPVAVMLGHLQVPGLTGTDPASLSKEAYNLLRSGGYGGPPFNGPVFTDDLYSMGAINQNYTVPEAALRALQAGADVALWVTTDQVAATLDRLEHAVNVGELSPARVHDALSHVAAAKEPNPKCGR